MRNPRRQIEEGFRNGRLVTVAAPIVIAGQSVVQCRCDCGGLKAIAVRHLHSAGTRSCGCLRKEHRSFPRHGHTRGGRWSKVYQAWINMNARCGNENAASYHNYGARGIKVCERWRRSFEAFLADVGEPPNRQASIDRINNDGNYEPGNVRWATRAEQSRNTRCTVLDIDLVNEIRGRREHGEGVSSIARRMSLSKETVRVVAERRTWKDVP